MSQEQRGGKGSTNIQVETLHVGMTYDDVRAIARDVFESNFSKLAETAAHIAAERATEIREQIINSLAESEEDLTAFSQPEKQVALLEAQKSYALSGDEQLKDMLVAAVVNLSREPERSLKSIVLQEALKVLPTLTRDQLQTIAASFWIRYVQVGKVQSLTDLMCRYVSIIGLGQPRLQVRDGDFRHIEYARCGHRIGGLSVGLNSILATNYAGLISKGYSPQVLVDRYAPEGVPMQMLIPCIRDGQRLQTAFLNERALQTATSRCTTHQFEVTKQLLSENLLSEDELKAELGLTEEGKLIQQIWHEERVSELELTSVGIAVGHSYVTGRMPEIATLDIWLNQ